MKIDFSKAPKIDGAILLGHSFGQDGQGQWHYIRIMDGQRSYSGYSQYSGLKEDSGEHYSYSFRHAPDDINTPAPRRRK